MKHKIITLFLSLAGVFSLGSCDSFLGGDTNIDPTRPSDASLNTLLPTVLYYSASATYSNAYTASQYSQQIGSVVAGGTDAQNRSSFAGNWSTLYLRVIPNCNEIIKKAEATESPYYAGIARLVMAYNLGLAATTWENVPFTEADNNLTNFSPNYDSQQTIYTTILGLIDQGIQDLAAANSLYVPGSDDLIYGGNREKWTKMGHTLKARYLLHLADKNGSSLNDVLTELQAGMQANADDFALIYNERNLNPWHTVALANNTGNFTVTLGARYINYLNGEIQGVKDPRLPLTAYTSSTDGVYLGVQPGEGSGSGSNTAFNNGTTFFGWFCKPDAPLQMLTFAEAQFIKAEAESRLNGKSEAALAAYKSGITAHMQKVGVTAANIQAFLGSEAVAATAAELDLSDIMVEKYKALFLMPEVWNDLRRYQYDADVFTGLALPENLNPELNGQWVQRGEYPSSETTRNSAVATNNFKPLTQRMWIFD